MTSSHDVIFLGFPSSGKTTYLALAYRSIATGVVEGLELGTYDDDHEYVNEIAKRLASCEEAERTQVEHDEQLALSLRVNSQDLFLRVPDMSGERWSHVLEDRRWSRDIDEQLRNASGLLLFVHSDQIENDPLIDDVDAGAAALDEGEPRSSVPDPAGDGTEVVRARVTQVGLVDLLQLVVRRRSLLPVRLSVVASAWDLMPDGLEPRQWLADELPLLNQYLETNTRWIDWTLWGVSAQGGDFSSDQRRQELLREDVVARAKVIGADGGPSTVMAPMVWALRLDC